MKLRRPHTIGNLGSLLFLLVVAAAAAQSQPEVPKPETTSDAALNDRLERTLVEADYDRMDLAKIIDDLRQRFGLNIHVNWSALEGSSVKRDTRVEVHLKQVPLATLLDFILVEAAGGETLLSYNVRGGVLFISSAEALARQTVLRTYDLTDLLGSAFGTRRFANTPILRLERAGGEATGGQAAHVPAGGQGGRGQGGGNVFGGGGGFGGQEEEAIAAQFVGIDEIIELIRSTVNPETWREAGGNIGSIRPAGARLIVTQTINAHRQIEELLTTLRRTAPVPLDADATIIRLPAASVTRLRNSAAARFPRLSDQQVRAAMQDGGAQVIFRGTTTGRNGQRLWFSSLTQRYVRGPGIPLVGDGVWAMQPVAAPVNEGLELIVLPMLAPDGASMTLDVQMGWAPPAEFSERAFTVGPGLSSSVVSETGRKSDGGKAGAADAVRTTLSEAAISRIDLPTRHMRTVSTMVALEPGESIALSIPGELEPAPAERRSEEWLILQVRKTPHAGLARS